MGINNAMLCSRRFGRQHKSSSPAHPAMIPHRIYPDGEPISYNMLRVCNSGKKDNRITQINKKLWISMLKVQSEGACSATLFKRGINGVLLTASVGA